MYLYFKKFIKQMILKENVAKIKTPTLFYCFQCLSPFA